MRAMLIVNPAAGQRHVEAELQKGVRYLEGRGWQIAWRRTAGPGDAISCAREAVERGYNIAIAAGGDGTIGQVVNGLAYSETALGVLPIGTTNVWAREIGIPIATPFHPNAIQEAVKLLADGQLRRVDLGKVNDRYFLMWAGVGVDAEVTTRVEDRPEAKRRLGKLAFVIALIVQTLNLKGTRGTICLDGKKITDRLLLIVASNIRLYGGYVRIAPMASIKDGLLDLCIFRGYNSISAYRLIISALLGLHVRDPEVTYYQCRHVEITTSKPLPVHADGDVLCTTPVEIKAVPNALAVIVPRHFSSNALLEDVTVAGKQLTAPTGVFASILDRLRH